MAYSLQLMRALMETHPERAAQLRPHVEALETTILTDPQLCLHRVRTLFESVHAMLAPQLGVDMGEVIEFHTRNSKIIKAPDFSVPNHPEGAKINGSRFLPSRILFTLDATNYEAARLEWAAERAGTAGEEAA